jgi:uncharacterized protein (TIGR03437 family)
MVRRWLWNHKATLALVVLLGWRLAASVVSDHESFLCAFILGDFYDVEQAESCRREYGATLPGAGPPLGTVLFEENRGQADPSFQFVSRAQGLTVFLSGGKVTLDLRDKPREPEVLRVSLAGAVEAPVEPLERLSGVTNYLIGNNPSRWVTGVSTYARIRYRNVYPGIDVDYYGHGRQLEHDFIVHPGADPARIRLAFSGAEEVALTPDGDVRVRVRSQELLWRKPVLYQTRNGQHRRIEGRYRQDGSAIRFEVGAYDPSQPLVIDPVVAYSTYVGRNSGEGASRIAVDQAGNAYITGVTNDGSFPITPGAVSGDAGSPNLLVTKLNPAGDAVIYSTHIGGASYDGSLGIAVDTNGNVYLAGGTRSENYPTTATALKSAYTPGDPGDCAVTKLNATGNSIDYSTFLGGSAADACSGIAVDGTGHAYLTGGTTSYNFPVTENAAQRIWRGDSDAFVTKLNPAGTAVLYSTYVGGIGKDAATAIALDARGNAYISGLTGSLTTFPTTAGALQRTPGGTTAQSVFPLGDAFVTKLNAAGTALVYSTLLGGNRDDAAGSIAVDGEGNAYVTGFTLSTNFPVTTAAYRTTFQGSGGNTILPGGDAFAAKLNPLGTQLVYATYLGGSREEWGTAIAVDEAGRAWIAGATLSPDFPVSNDAHQSKYGGLREDEVFHVGDAFLAQLNASGTGLVYSSFVGGFGDDYAAGVAVDRLGNTYVSGGTTSLNLPVTANAAQRQYGGAAISPIPLGDAFVLKLGNGSTPPPSPPVVTLQSVASAASYVGNGVSPGEVVVLTGTNIGPATLASAQGSLPSALGDTRVLFDGASAPVLYASFAQTSVIVPYGVTGKPSTQIVVEFRGGRSAVFSVPVLAAKPALFSANSTGRGQGAILNEDSSFNSTANPAGRGRIIILYATGFGQTAPPGIDGQVVTQVLPKPVLPVSVTIGGLQAEVLYAGAAPGMVAGVFQINARVPDTAPVGELDVMVTVGAARSQSGLTVAVR